MTDSNTHIYLENDQGRISAAKLECLMNWMRSAQTPSHPQRLSAEQLSQLLAQISNANDRAAQTPT